MMNLNLYISCPFFRVDFINLLPFKAKWFSFFIFNLFKRKNKVDWKDIKKACTTVKLRVQFERSYEAEPLCI